MCAPDSDRGDFFSFFLHESPEWPLNGLLHKGHLVT